MRARWVVPVRRCGRRARQDIAPPDGADAVPAGHPSTGRPVRARKEADLPSVLAQLTDARLDALAVVRVGGTEVGEVLLDHVVAADLGEPAGDVLHQAL